MGKPSIHISGMEAKTSYEDHHQLLDYLAKQLKNGSLALVLGAGASFGFGLPGWKDLVDQMFTDASKARPSDLSEELAAEMLWKEHYKGNDKEFASAVREALYRTASLTFNDLRKNDLLTAIGALAMASSRGNAANIISFNFDDVIKLYLSYFGYDVNLNVNLPNWNRRADVHILHPHGLLPSEKTHDIPRPIVFTKNDYDRIVGNSSDYWHGTILDIFRSHTCLFIGLSGNDNNLTSLLAKARDSHACRDTGECYWGIRFGLKTDPLINMWETRGIYNKEVKDYDEIPKILFEICQRAAMLKIN